MSNWKYTDNTNQVVFRMLESGGCESCLASVLDVNTPILPADTPSPDSVPVSPRQIRQALSQVGLRTAVESAISSSNQDTKDWYEYGTLFERSHPQVIGMGIALGVSSSDLDNLWLLAATL
jgi:hypothetical protein